MKLGKFFFSALLIILLASCTSDENDFNNESLNPLPKELFLQYDEWNDYEKSFFSLEHSNLTSQSRNGKSDDRDKVYYHPFVIQAYNYIAKENHKDPFVNAITSKVGFPIWGKSRVFKDKKNNTQFISIPFAFPQENKTTAIFTLTKIDNSDFILYGVDRDKIIEQVQNCENYNLGKELLISDKVNFDIVDINLADAYENCILSQSPAGSTSVSSSPCVWISVELCTDEDTQTGFLAGTLTFLPPHLDHDSDGIPNDQDQDWWEWSDRYNVTQEDLETWWHEHWEYHMQDEYGVYDEFWENIDDQFDWDDYINWTDEWDDFYDDIFDGWDDYDDQWDDDRGDDRDTDPDQIWYAEGLTLNNNISTTRNIRCNFYLIKDCNDAINGDLSEWWAGVFDEVIPCPNCEGSEFIGEEERFIDYFSNLYIENYGITDQSIIDALNEFAESLVGIIDVDIFNELMEEKHRELWFESYPELLNQRSEFLESHPNDEYAEDLANEHWRQMVLDVEYREFVENSISFGGVMWSIASELIGDKVVDIIIGFIPGFGQADEIRDAIKAAKNGDVLEFLFEAAKIVGKNTPVGKFLKGAEAFTTLKNLYKKIDKINDAIGNFAENVIEQMWNIVKTFPKELRTNVDLISGLTKTINRGLKSIDDVMASIPDFTNMTSARMKHILHGDASGGLHHASGIVNDPSKKIIDILPPDSKGVYKIKIEGVEGWNSMFPDSKSEIGVAKGIQNVFDSPNSTTINLPNGRKQINGVDSQGVEIEIITESNGSVVTAYPVYKP